MFSRSEAISRSTSMTSLRSLARSVRSRSRRCSLFRAFLPQQQSRFYAATLGAPEEGPHREQPSLFLLSSDDCTSALGVIKGSIRVDLPCRKTLEQPL
jgi:hypothetical protein